MSNEREKYYRVQFSERRCQKAVSISKYDYKKNYPGAMAD
jgi:hypothetical protein